MLRDFFFKDIWLKFFSLGLAVLIWVTVNFAIRNENAAGAMQLRAFTLPVLVVSEASDVKEFRVRPAEIEVVVSAEKAVLDRIRPKELRALVDLTEMESPLGLRKRVEISTPPGVTLVSATPAEVEIIVPPARPLMHP